MTHRYKTKGTCSRYIDIEMNGQVIEKVIFHGGCAGNTAGISALVKGMTYQEAKEKLDGITCGNKATSCPDQLIRGIEEALAQ